MRLTTRTITFSAVATLILALPSLSTAQVPVSVGTRAQGMAGAFTAVADDASATWWNPAGLASGAMLSLLVERVRVESHDPAPDDAFESQTDAFALGFPALGLSYYRFRVDQAAALPAIGEDAGDREEDTSGPAIGAVAISQYGVTVGQSAGGGLVLATTFKLLRAGQLQVYGAPGGLGSAENLDVPVSTRFDMDFGLMATVGMLRIGGTLRNVTTPDFGEDYGELELDRQVRVGAALVGDRLPWPVTVAFDADLTETTSFGSDVRHAAGGVEAWVWQRRIGLRGGFSVNTTGAGGEAASGGVSVQVQSGLHLQGVITRGSDKTREGWSLGLSVSY